MNNIAQKNVIQSLKPSTQLPYLEPDFVALHEMCESTNANEMNNIAQQLLDNDLALERILNEASAYMPGPKTYDAATIASKPNGSKFFGDLKTAACLDVLRKVEDPLSATIKLVEPCMDSASFLFRFGGFVYASVDGMIKRSRDPSITQFEAVAVAGNDTPKAIGPTNWYATDDALLFCTTSQVYQLSTIYELDDYGQEIENQCLIPLLETSIDTSKYGNATSIAVNASREQFALGTTKGIILVGHYPKSSSSIQPRSLKVSKVNYIAAGSTASDPTLALHYLPASSAAVEDKAGSQRLVVGSEQSLRVEKTIDGFEDKIVIKSPNTAFFTKIAVFNNKIYVGTTNGLCSLDETFNLVEEFPEDIQDKVVDIVVFNKNLYVATKFEIYRINQFGCQPISPKIANLDQVAIGQNWIVGLAACSSVLIVVCESNVFYFTDSEAIWMLELLDEDGKPFKNVVTLCSSSDYVTVGINTDDGGLVKTYHIDSLKMTNTSIIKTISEYADNQLFLDDQNDKFVKSVVCQTTSRKRVFVATQRKISEINGSQMKWRLPSSDNSTIVDIDAFFHDAKLKIAVATTSQVYLLIDENGATFSEVHAQFPATGEEIAGVEMIRGIESEGVVLLATTFSSILSSIDLEAQKLDQLDQLNTINLRSEPTSLETHGNLGYACVDNQLCSIELYRQILSSNAFGTSAIYQVIPVPNTESFIVATDSCLCCLEANSTLIDDIDKDHGSLDFVKTNIGSRCALFIDVDPYANVLYFGYKSKDKGGVLSAVFKSTVDSLRDIAPVINGASRNVVAGLSGVPSCLVSIKDDAKRIYAIVNDKTYVQNQKYSNFSAALPINQKLFIDHKSAISDVYSYAPFDYFEKVKNDYEMRNGHIYATHYGVYFQKQNARANEPAKWQRLDFDSLATKIRGSYFLLDDMNVGYVYNTDVSTEISPSVVVPPTTLISGLINDDGVLVNDIAFYEYGYVFPDSDSPHDDKRAKFDQYGGSLFALTYDKLYEYHDTDVSFVDGYLSVSDDGTTSVQVEGQLSVTVDMSKPLHEVLSAGEGVYFSNCDLEFIDNPALIEESIGIRATLLVASNGRQVWQAELSTSQFSFETDAPQRFLESSSFVEYVLDPEWKPENTIIRAWLNNGDVVVWMDDFTVYQCMVELSSGENENENVLVPRSIQPLAQSMQSVCKMYTPDTMKNQFFGVTTDNQLVDILPNTTIQIDSAKLSNTTKLYDVFYYAEKDEDTNEVSTTYYFSTDSGFLSAKISRSSFSQINQINDTAKFLYGLDDRLFGIGRTLGLVEGHVDLDGNLVWEAVPGAVDAIGTNLQGCSMTRDPRNQYSQMEIYAWNDTTIFKGAESDDHEATSLSVWFDNLPSRPTSLLSFEAANTYNSYGVNTMKFFASGYDKLYNDEIIFSLSHGALYINRHRALRAPEIPFLNGLQCSMLAVDPENRKRIFRVTNHEDDTGTYISSAIYPSLSSSVPCYESTNYIDKLLIDGQNAMIQDDSSTNFRYGTIDYTTDKIQLFNEYKLLGDDQNVMSLFSDKDTLVIVQDQHLAKIEFFKMNLLQTSYTGSSGALSASGEIAYVEKVVQGSKNQNIAVIATTDFENKVLFEGSLAKIADLADQLQEVKLSSDEDASLTWIGYLDNDASKSKYASSQPFGGLEFPFGQIQSRRLKLFDNEQVEQPLEIVSFDGRKYVLCQNQLLSFTKYGTSTAYQKLATLDCSEFSKFLENDEDLLVVSKTKLLQIIRNGTKTQTMKTKLTDLKTLADADFGDGIGKRWFIADGLEIMTSTNLRNWKPVFQLDYKKMNDVFDIAVINKDLYCFATDTGIYATKYSWQMMHDVKAFTRNDAVELYTSLKESTMDPKLSTAMDDHIKKDHSPTSLVSRINTEFSSVDLDDIDPTWQRMTSSDSGLVQINNDIITDMAFGSYSDGNVVVCTSSFADADNATAELNELGMHDIKDTTYISKRWMSGLTELYINVPTTSTRYLGRLYGAAGCKLSPTTTLTRPNLEGVCNTDQDGQLSTHYTSIVVGIASAEYFVDELLDIQINGNSLPLQVYKDSTGNDNASQMYSSYIEPSLAKSWDISKTDEEGNFLFNFACFGTDAQAIRMLFYDSHARANSPYIKIAFDANGGEGEMPKQKFMLVGDDPDTWILEQKPLKKNRFTNDAAGYRKIFAGWTLVPREDNYGGSDQLLGDQIYENSQVFPTSTDFASLMKELGRSEDVPDPLKKKEEITLYAVWMTYQFSDSDTRLLMNSDKTTFKIAEVGVDESTNLKDTIIIDFGD